MNIGEIGTLGIPGLGWVMCCYLTSSKFLSEPQSCASIIVSKAAGYPLTANTKSKGLCGPAGT